MKYNRNLQALSLRKKTRAVLSFGKKMSRVLQIQWQPTFCDAARRKEETLRQNLFQEISDQATENEETK